MIATETSLSGRTLRWEFEDGPTARRLRRALARGVLFDVMDHWKVPGGKRLELGAQLLQSGSMGEELVTENCDPLSLVVAGLCSEPLLFGQILEAHGASSKDTARRQDLFPIEQNRVIRALPEGFVDQEARFRHAVRLKELSDAGVKLTTRSGRHRRQKPLSTA